MWMLSLSTPQKVGVIFWGFLAGIAAAVACFLAGVLLCLVVWPLFVGWNRILPLALSFYICIPVGLTVWARFCWVRLRGQDMASTRIDDSPR
jgi:hypothetical protein